MNTIKNIMIIIGSIVAGSAMIYLAESLDHKLYPLPEGIDVYDSVAMKEYIFSMPVIGFLILLVGYELGGFCAGFFAALLSSPKQRTKNALIAGGLFTIGSIINLILIPHPLWFGVISSLVFIPFALLGSKLSPMLRKQ